MEKQTELLQAALNKPKTSTAEVYRENQVLPDCSVPDIEDTKGNAGAPGKLAVTNLRILRPVGEWEWVMTLLGLLCCAWPKCVFALRT